MKLVSWCHKFCPKFSWVLKTGVVVIKCQHYYCRTCIESIHTTRGRLECPTCRQPFTVKTDLNEPTLFMKKMLYDIRLKCPFKSCPMILTYDDFARHKIGCEHDPNKMVKCPNCTKCYKKIDETKHRVDCMEHIKTENDKLRNKIVELEITNWELHDELARKNTTNYRNLVILLLNFSVRKNDCKMYLLRIYISRCKIEHFKWSTKW